MKANLTQKEPEMLKFWEENKIYEKLQNKNSGSKHYILHDGPPYANGHIHIGHALNKILKDIIVKFKSMQGFYSPYVPGWDCHGLPIELQVDKNLGEKKNKVDILEKENSARNTQKNLWTSRGRNSRGSELWETGQSRISQCHTDMKGRLSGNFQSL